MNAFKIKKEILEVVCVFILIAIFMIIMPSDCIKFITLIIICILLFADLMAKNNTMVTLLLFIPVILCVTQNVILGLAIDKINAMNLMILLTLGYIQYIFLILSRFVKKKFVLKIKLFYL